MNLVGKILVVALFVMSLVFSAFTLAVHSTHKHWKEMVVNEVATPTKPLGLKPQLDKAQTDIARLQSAIEEAERNYERNKKESQQRLGQLESFLKVLDNERDALQSKAGELGKNLTAAIEAADQKTKVLDSVREENKTLREDNDKVRKDRDDKLREVVSLQDRVANLTTEHDRYLKRHQQLMAQITAMRIALQDAGIQLDRKPTVFGLVRATQAAPDYVLVEISIGKDDGLEVGMELDVFRLGLGADEGTYLGKIKLTRVEPDISIGQVIPNTLKGAIQRYDHVATRLSVRAK